MMKPADGPNHNRRPRHNQIGEGYRMDWLGWALLSALFAGLTAILAKVGVKDVNSNLATALRTTVILAFAWAVALAAGRPAFGDVPRRAWLYLVLSGLATGASWLCYFRAL